MSFNEWYTIENIANIDSPALVVYKERVQENIRLLKNNVASTKMLRPHVKTNKIAEVCQMMMDAGIYKFKCATIAEAEMLAIIGAKDVLLSYQPVGPKLQRFIKLIETYPNTLFSCLVDNILHADFIATACREHHISLNVFLDLNTGMNRTGITPDEKAFQLYLFCLKVEGLHPMGLHGYDGHIRDTDFNLRQEKSDGAFQLIIHLADEIKKYTGNDVQIVAGGSPTFTTHAHRKDIECSPGTFIFWDWGYKHILPDAPFDYAALVLTRVISIIDENTICTDLGHKSVAAENPLPRVYFLNAPNTKPIGQSEEHLVVEVPDSSIFKIGDVLYGVPVHICPTVALYEKAIVIENHVATEEWKVIARDRFINI